MTLDKIAIFGATSAVAQELARLLAGEGRSLILVGRSSERLDAMKGDLLARGAPNVVSATADLADCSRHRELVQMVTQAFPDIDSAVIAYGTLLDQEECAHSPELAVQELHTNFLSQASLLTVLADYFAHRRAGQIVAITSVAGDRGRRSNYVYGSAKGGTSLFVQGLRCRLHGTGVGVITVKPGPIDTPMTAHLPKTHLFTTPELVAQSIHSAMKRGSSRVIYVPAYWRLLMAIIRAIPESIYQRLPLP